MRLVRTVLDVVISLSVLAAFVCWVLLLHLAVPGSQAVLVAVESAGIAGAIHVVLHEGGHAVVAVALGLRVRGIRVFGLRIMGQPGASGGRNHVRTDAGEIHPPPAARFVLVLLAGPAVNIAIAVFATGMAIDPSIAAYPRAVAAGVAASGALMGVGNLVPMRRQGRASDGLNALRWSLGARRRAREAHDARGRLPVGTYSIDPARSRLQAAAEDLRADVAGPALVALLARSVATVGAEAAVWRHYSELLEMARRPDLPARLSRALAGEPGMTVCLAVLHRFVSEGRKPDPTELARIVALLAAGRGHAPDDLVVRTGLGLASLLLDRDDEARRVLSDLDTHGCPPDEVGRAYAVRAQAEAACRDFDQAERLIRAARELAPDDALVRFSDALITRSRSNSGPVGEATGTRQTPSA